MASTPCPVPGHAERLRVIHPVKGRGGRTVLPGGLEQKWDAPTNHSAPIPLQGAQQTPKQ